MGFGLQLASKLHSFDIVVESDYQRLIDSWKLILLYNGFGFVVQDCLYATSVLHLCNWSFIRRDGNFVAHALAKDCPPDDFLRVWIEEVPLSIDPLVASDVVHVS